MKAAPNGLVLRFGGSLVEQLGSQLYPSATATVAELISNAWDADAKNVWVSLPFGEWREDNEIVVVDDGIGMSYETARDAYLIVGRKRRVISGETSPGGRRVHGRKGIGKLAAFGTAGILECTTIREGQVTAFRLDYDRIRKLTPDVDYPVETAEDQSPVVNPDTAEPLVHGTRIRLTRLLLKRDLNMAAFVSSMSRRFAIDSTDMRIVINGEQLRRFDMDVEFKFPRDGLPFDEMTTQEGWAVELLPSGQAVRWWIGFTALPLREELHQGISILANKKMAQRAFKFERISGTEGQLGQEYLVGEVEADWLDTGIDIEDDLIQSNRDQLQLEDDRLSEFLEWGRRRLGWALRKRNELRAEKAVATYEASPKTLALLKPFTAAERKQLTKIALVVSTPEITDSGVETMMETVVNARSDLAVRSLMNEIDAQDEPIQERIWDLVQQFGLIDARRTLSLVEARLATINKLQEAIKGGATEVPEIHKLVRKDAWLIDPRWYLLDDEVDPAALGIKHENAADPASGLIMDFLFVLQPSAPAEVDEVVVVEIKRGTHPDGITRHATYAEVEKFQRYVLTAQTFYDQHGSVRPRVRGLMIAQGYAGDAKALMQQLRANPEPKYAFKTWDQVIEQTHRLHLAWLNVSQKRADVDAA